jgi:twinkle protein
MSSKDIFPASDNIRPEPKTPQNFTYEFIARRGISKATHEFFGVKARIGETGEPLSVVYPWPGGWSQIKGIKEKTFYSMGTVTPGVFGKDKFPAGSARAVTIVEGADDALSYVEMMGRFPVVAVRSATINQALADVREDYDYLNSFERIYLCLDNDEPGKKAAEAIASVFGYQKVYHVKNAPRKDATEYCENHEKAIFKNIWYNADRFLPDGIVSSFASLKKIFDNRTRHPRWETPFPKLNYMLGGGLELHRVYLLSGMTGIGKTEFFRACQHKFFEDRPSENIAILHYEEPVDETVERAVGYKVKSPIHLQENSLPPDKVLEEYEKLVGRDDRVHFSMRYGSENPDDVLAKVRFLVAACGCTQVYLDNITVLFTGRHQDDERKDLDYFSTQMEMLVKELPFTLVMISHENEQEGTRGSANINKVADVWLNLRRDVEAANEFSRRLLSFKLKKNRQASRTGPAGLALYDDQTGILADYSGELPT